MGINNGNLIDCFMDDTVEKNHIIFQYFKQYFLSLNLATNILILTGIDLLDSKLTFLDYHFPK